MKRLICVLLHVLLVAGCNLLESQYCLVDGDGSSKYPHSVRTGTGKDSTYRPADIIVKDTTVWISAVEFPEDYEWRKDSSYGDVDARILLYRDFQLVLSVPAEGNPSQDRHHIVGGKLFTEHVSGEKTVFCRNGETFLDVTGACTLAGYLESGGHEYVLVRPMASQGFAFYRDRRLMIYRENAHLCGSFSEPAYSSGGGLYEDEGKCTFCYWTAEGYSGRMWHRVMGETESILENIPDDAVTVRVIDGRTVVAAGVQGGMAWTEASIWDVGCPVISGVGMNDGMVETAIYRPDTSSLTALSQGDGTVYVSDTSEIAICLSGGGYVCICGRDGTKETLYGAWKYVYPSCACLVGSSLLLALTPERLGAPSVIRWKGQSVSMELNGFITNVAYTVE